MSQELEEAMDEVSSKDWGEAMDGDVQMIRKREENDKTKWTG